MIKQFLVVATVLILSACQTTQSKIDGIAKQGAEFSGVYPTSNGRAAVPLPEGKWVVSGVEVSRETYRNPIQRVMLIRSSGKDVTGLIEITAPVAYSGSGFLRSEYCKSQGQQHLQLGQSVTGGVQDCWGVHYYQSSLSGNLPGHVAQTVQFAATRDLSLPTNGETVAFRFADRAYFLDVDYMDLWPVFDLAKAKAWGREWYPKVKVGFEGS